MSIFGMPTLIVRKFEIDENAANGNYLQIEGRTSGLVSWLLTLMKLDTLTTMELNTDRLSVKASNLSGQIHTVMPLRAISSTQCGFSKSLAWLTWAIIIFIGGLLSRDSGVFIVSLIISALFLLVYIFSKNMLISVSTGGAKGVAIAFKRGVVEGISVDLNRTLKAIELLNKVVAEKRYA